MTTEITIDIPIYVKGKMHVIRITIKTPNNGNPTIKRRTIPSNPHTPHP